MRLNHLGPVVECPRRPINALGILLRAEARKGQQGVGHMAAGVARVQAHDLMQMLDGALVFTCVSFQSVPRIRSTNVSLGFISWARRASASASG